MENDAIWQVLFFFSAVAYWPAGLLLFSRLETLRPRKGGEVPLPPPVSIIIPARNEERNLSGLLGALESLDPVPLEIIVVDDRSEDRTASVVEEVSGRSGGVAIRLLRSPGAPAGWTGKNFACRTGAVEARGQMLLFLDADVSPVMYPSLLGDLYRRWEEACSDGGREGALVSAQPFHRMERAYERLSLFFNLAALAGSRDFGIFRRRCCSAGAFGPCIFTDLRSYRETGGHEAVAGAIVDDLALAGLYRESGFPVRSFLGDRSISFRMYPDGIGQLVEGWTKNMATGAGSAGGRVLFLMIFWVAGMISAACALVSSAGSGQPAVAAAAVLLYLAWVVQIRVVSGRTGNFGVTGALLYPVLLLFFTALFFRSLFETFILGSVSWRGRRIPLGKRRKR